MSEAFFEVSRDSLDTYPDIYEQLKRFHRQDLARRFAARARGLAA